MSRRAGANRRATRSPKIQPAEPIAAAFRWPSMAELVSPRAPFLLPALALLASRIGLSFYLPFASEDAYITFRYARNLAAGVGLVFNPGQRVFGFSSPLWTLWMALGFKLGAPPVPWARITTLGLELLTLVIVVSLLRRYASNRAAWCFGVFWAAWPYFAAVSLSGMENQAMVGLIALAAIASASRGFWSGPLIAAVALMRPEGLAVAAVLAWPARWRDRLIGVSLIAAGAIALASYYGTAVPQSLLAKSHVYGTPGPWYGRHWWEWLSPVPMGRFPQVSDLGHLNLLSLIFLPSIAFGARELWGYRKSPLAIFIAACLVVWIGYVALGVAFFWWYLAVPLAGLATLASVGFPRIAREPVLYLSAGLLVVGLWIVVPVLYLGRAQSEYLGFATVGEYLAGHAQPGQKVMLEPIGMVGYRAPLIVVDEVGLVSPQVARRRLRGPGWYADVAMEERPDWLVVRRGFLRAGNVFAGAGTPFRNVAERDSLFARYRVEAAIDTVSGDNTLLVLDRR